MASRAADRPVVRDHSGDQATGFSKTNVASEPFTNITRENGIVFKAEDNVSVQCYVNALSVSGMNPAEIVSASRISNGRVAVYLKSREAVEEAVVYGLEYNDSFISITPLVKPTERLVLSNVYPELPNAVIARNLSSFCKPVSAIKPIPLGIKDKELSHVMSFRRQVHAIIETNVTIPDHMNIFHAGVNYRVFISNDSVKCFSCGENGHISKHCKKTTQAEPSTSDTNMADFNPLNPPPKFVHGKKSDPKHPSKQSRRDSLTDQNKPSTSDKPADTDAQQHSATEPDARFLTGTPLKQQETEKQSASTADKHNTTLSPAPSKQNTQHLKTSNNTTVPSIWGSPPAPSRETSPLFAEVVAKGHRKKSKPKEVVSNPLVQLKSPSPQRKLRKLSDTPQMERDESVSQTSTEENISQILDESQMSTESPPIHPSQLDSESDHESVSSVVSVFDQEGDGPGDLNLTKGPLQNEEVVTFLKCVKSRRKPLDVARKFTHDIPGLVKQLKPLRNSPLFTKNMQQRIRKLVRNLDPSDPIHLFP